MFPHEIISSLNDDENGGEIVELQRKRMVDDIARKGKLNDFMAICDLFGSMSGNTMKVSVSMNL